MVKMNLISYLRMYFFKRREFVDDTIKMEYCELGIS